MDEIDLVSLVDHVEWVERTFAAGKGMIFAKSADEMSEVEAELANAELERRGINTRVERVAGSRMS